VNIKGSNGKRAGNPILLALPPENYAESGSTAEGRQPERAKQTSRARSIACALRHGMRNRAFRQMPPDPCPAGFKRGNRGPERSFCALTARHPQGTTVKRWSDRHPTGAQWPLSGFDQAE